MKQPITTQVKQNKPRLRIRETNAMHSLKLATTFVFMLVIANCYGVCKISIQQDLPQNELLPLLLRPQILPTQSSNEAYYLPNNRYGDITFKQNDVIHQTCPGAHVIHNGNPTGQSVVPIRCYNGKTFEVISTSARVGLSEFRCSQPGHIVRYTGRSCLTNYREIEVGFQVTATIFLRDITICFDPAQQTTAYTAHNLTKFIAGSQNPARPQFTSGNFFNVGRHQVDNLYTRYVQRVNLNRQLGLPANSLTVIDNGDNFFSRGHLTANADFVYGNQRNATFVFVNAAPQWHPFNEGNWNELEKSVRHLAGTRNIDLEVYVGTHDVMSLPHATSKRQIPLYLYSENGRLGIPVPRMYWMVVYDRSTKAGVAFVGLNNPYAQSILQTDVLCTCICHRLTFGVTWNRNVVVGYGYCCDVNDLRRNVRNIPNIQVNSVLL